MRRVVTLLAVVLALAVSVSAQTFTATVSYDDRAEVKTDDLLVVGTKIWVGSVGETPAGPFGKFTSYTASGGLPTITGGDLHKYGWALKATVTSVDLPNRTATYAGEFYLLAPGYGFDDITTEYLEKATFTNLKAVWEPDWSKATVSGYLLAEVGTRQPTNESSITWPVPVDWSAANPGYFTGTFISDADSQSGRSGWLYGTLSAPIPDASTIVLFSVGLLPAIRLVRRR